MMGLSLTEILVFISFLAWWVAGLAVLIKLFQKEGFLKGLFGLICFLYTYIWGWGKVSDPSLKLKTWMWIWTAALLLPVITYLATR